MEILEEGKRLLKAISGQGYELTDAGNGELLADFLNNLYVYVPERKDWFYYDGKMWREDIENMIMQDAVRALRKARQGAAQIQDAEKASKLFNWYVGSENQRKLKASLDYAATVPFMCVRIDQFDKDDMLLNVQNGTVNLRTGELRKHNREDYLTKICNVNYNPDAKSELFETFLNEITEGNEEKKRYIQKLCGYCCTGKISEEEFYQAKGSGQNGKTKLFETIKYCLGSYAVTASPDILMQKDMNSIPNDIARLCGTRLVIMSEPDPGKRFSDNAIKSLTGGDTITARFLHKEFFEFQMKAKIIMLTNHEIKAIGTDYGLWRRIVVIPFTYQVPEEKKDKHLQEKLIAEAEAVLAWMVKGCLMWQQEGLEQPQELVNVKDEYRRGQDAVGLFLDECCLIDERSQVPKGVLYSAFIQWCNENNEYEMSQRNFSTRLREKGFIDCRGTGGIRMWKGISIGSDAVTQSDVNSDKLPYKGKHREFTGNNVTECHSVTNKKEWWKEIEEAGDDICPF